MAGLDPETASEPEMEAAEEILAFCNQLLHAEDIVERSLVPMVQKMARQRISLPPSLQVPVQKMMDQLARNLNICATVLLRQNTSETNPLAGQKDFFRTLESTATAAYFERLRKQPGDSNSSAEYNLREEVVTYQLTLLRDLRRVNTHIVAAASYSLPTGED